MKPIAAGPFLSLAVFASACAGEGPRDADAGPDSSSDAGENTDTAFDTDTGTDTTPAVVGALHGTVMAPSGEFPIPGALVYVTQGDGPEIPDSIYCYECEDMTGKNWALSAADGTWSIPDIPVGDWNIVTRKGFFQRQRAVQE